jgi:hypothetical protein
MKCPSDMKIGPNKVDLEKVKQNRFVDYWGPTAEEDGYLGSRKPHRKLTEPLNYFRKDQYYVRRRSKVDEEKAEEVSTAKSKKEAAEKRCQYARKRSLYDRKCKEGWEDQTGWLNRTGKMVFIVFVDFDL